MIAANLKRGWAWALALFLILMIGLSRLYLVNPKHFPHEDAVAMSSGATDVLDNAVVVESIEHALAGTVAQAALTARRREMALPVRDVRSAATEPATLLAGSDAEVALVFGTESSGLTNEEVAMCSLPVTISTGYIGMVIGESLTKLPVVLDEPYLIEG